MVGESNNLSYKHQNSEHMISKLSVKVETFEIEISFSEV